MRKDKFKNFLKCIPLFFIVILPLLLSVFLSVLGEVLYRSYQVIDDLNGDVQRVLDTISTWYWKLWRRGQ